MIEKFFTEIPDLGTKYYLLRSVTLDDTVVFALLRQKYLEKWDV